jgi:hypothetical protein
MEFDQVQEQLAIVEHSKLAGIVHWMKFNEKGHLVSQGSDTNIVTQYGDQYYGERAAPITGAPGPITGIKLGTGTNPTGKTGTGTASLQTYLSGSAQALDAGYPQSSLSPTSGRRITYQVTWVPGDMTTASVINEGALVNESSLTDTTSGTGATIARVLFNGGINGKAAGEYLTIIWNHDILGAP